MVSESVSTKKPNRIIKISIKIIVTLWACFWIYLLPDIASVFQEMFVGMDIKTNNALYGTIIFTIMIGAILFWTVLFIKEKLSKFWLRVGYFFILLSIILCIRALFEPLPLLIGTPEK